MLEYTPRRRLSGGLRLPGRKNRSTQSQIGAAFIPSQLSVPLGHTRDRRVEPIVEPGSLVLKGQALTAATPQSAMPDAHAPTSGVVRAIESRLVPAGSSLQQATCIEIEPDGEDRSPESAAPPDWPGDRQSCIELMRRAGILGLGGAAFPAFAKMDAVLGTRMLIVNGAECEPYISCDDMLMRTAAAQIVAGCSRICDLLAFEIGVIAIERDKPEAIEALTQALRAAADDRLRIAEIPTIYPAGGERQLIQILTGEEVPSSGFPADIGYLCQNVGTAYAIERLAAAGEPMISRVVTVTGAGVIKPQNLHVLIGTPIDELIEHCGGYSPDAARLIVGGNMMGYTLPSDAYPVSKSSNCLFVASTAETASETEGWACIRCGECSRACPARLLPQELNRAANIGDFDALDRLGLIDCIDCGCCDVVCPSHIPLTQTFRNAKRKLAGITAERALGERSDERFRQHEERQRRQSKSDAEHQAGLIEQVSSDDGQTSAAIAEAVERARQRRLKKQDTD